MPTIIAIKKDDQTLYESEEQGKRARDDEQLSESTEEWEFIDRVVESDTNDLEVHTQDQPRVAYIQGHFRQDVI